jgi:hypothetical protein
VSLYKIVEFVKKKFELPVEYELSENLLFIKIKGLDNPSLANYIQEKYPKYKVTSKEVEGYKISIDGWVKIEKCGS